MAINLIKGQRATIGSRNFTVGLGWDANVSDTGVDFDLDASVFVLGENHKLVSESHFIFYNNLTDPEQAVRHSGDNLTGAGEGDDESITINLDNITNRASELVIVVTIHEACVRRQNFGQVRNAYVRIIDNDSGNELMRFDLDEDFSVETAVSFGRIYKRHNEWKFEAVGVGSHGDLQTYVDQYC